MEILREECFLIDYLKSFELIDSQDELKENNSVLDKVIDKNYKKTIESYVSQISQNFNSSVTRKFIGENFNILFSIVVHKKVTSFENLINEIEKLTFDELTHILSVDFRLSDGFSLLTIDSLSLSFEDKWKLAVVMNEFDALKKVLIEEMSENYNIYSSYVNELYEKYGEKIKQVEETLSNGEYVYNNIFSDYVDENTFNDIGRRVFLLISVNGIIVHKTKTYNLIAVGLYVFDFYLELERQKKIDEVKVTQILKSLSDPTRYGIIKAINKGITSNSVLADMFSVTRAAISMQFKHLQINDIIIVDETTKHYTINKDLIKYAIETVQLDLDLLDK